jgi:hypothetical protein
MIVRYEGKSQGAMTEAFGESTGCGEVDPGV